MNIPAHRIVIDTDIGTDVDDLWTLAMVPGRPDMTLVAVTVVYVDTVLRARLASLALDGMGLDVPVARGLDIPLGGKDPLWAGFEGDGVPGLDAASPGVDGAVDLLCAETAADPGGIDVVTIGPLTNIAAAIRTDPGFAGRVGRLVVMGGEFSQGWPEHNVSADREAARTVFHAGIATTIVPLDQTRRVLLSTGDLADIHTRHPLGPLMADRGQRFRTWLRERLPTAAADASPAHDPTALLALLEPHLFEVTPMTVTVDDHGRTHGRPDPGSPVGVVTDCDPDAIHRAILDALDAQQSRPGCDPQADA